MHRPTIESLGRQVVEGNSNRRHFERLPDQLAQQIADEALELIEEISESMVTGDVFNVVGEIGDLYVLLAQLCDDLGVNPVHAMELKILRNQYKYPDHTLNNGYSREEAVYLAKTFYKETIGGDVAFSHAYLDFLSVDTEELVDGSDGVVVTVFDASSDSRP